MRKVMFFALALIFTFALTGAASAQTYVTPCYEWQCNNSPSGTCNFDAGNCSTGGGVWYWHWDFGDGTTDNWNTSATTSHYYPSSSWANVTLTLTFFGKPDEDTTCRVDYRNVIGPPTDLIGDCDATIPDGCNC